MSALSLIGRENRFALICVRCHQRPAVSNTHGYCESCELKLRDERADLHWQEQEDS